MHIWPSVSWLNLTTSNQNISVFIFFLSPVLSRFAIIRHFLVSLLSLPTPPINGTVSADAAPPTITCQVYKNDAHMLDFEWHFNGNFMNMQMSEAVIHMRENLPTTGCVGLPHDLNRIYNEFIGNSTDKHQTHLSNSISNGFDSNESSPALLLSISFWRFIYLSLKKTQRKNSDNRETRWTDNSQNIRSWVESPVMSQNSRKPYNELN